MNLDPQPEPDSAWYCQTCGQHHPIPPLARDCEAKHEAERQAQSQEPEARP